MSDANSPTRRSPVPTLVLASAGLIALVTVGIVLSRGNGGSQAPAGEPVGNAAAASPAAPNPSQQALSRIDALRQRLAQNPDDAAGWYELGSLYRDFEQFPDARQAFQRAMQLRPNEVDYITATGEALLVTGGDGAHREAEGLFRRALTIKTGDIRARYYLATLKDAAGDHRGAVDELLALLRDRSLHPSNGGQIRATLTDIAERNRIDIAGRLPPEPAQTAATAAIPGPTRDQMDAARAISPSQQNEMVNGMVGRLVARLQQNPRDERGWMMLMRSRQVLNDAAGARQALGAGVAAFQDDPAVQQRLRAAAAELGITEG